MGFSWTDFDLLDNEFKKGEEVEIPDEEKSFEQLSLEKEIIKKKEILKTHICTQCNQLSVIFDTSESKFMCTNSSCGKVYEDILDESPEWHGSLEDPNRGIDQSRVGMNINEYFPRSALTTKILGYGNQSFRRFQRYNSMVYPERKLLNKFKIMNSKVEGHFIDESTLETSKKVFKMMSENDKRRGDKVLGDMTAAIYYSSMKRGSKVSKNELIDSFEIKKKKFTRGCNHYKETVFMSEPEYYQKMEPINEYKDIIDCGQKIGLTEIYIKIAQYIAFMSVKLGFFQKITPASIAAGSILALNKIYGLKILKDDISKHCNVSSVTTGKAYNKISPYIKILIPTEELFNKFITNYDIIVS